MRDKISCIYCIQNKMNKKQYIGSTVNFTYRKSRHLYELRKSKHHSNYLQNSWNKYGENNFVFFIIEEVDTNNLLVKEQYWIDTLKPVYNTCKVSGTVLGIKRTLEQRKKMSEIAKLRDNSGIRNNFYGKKHTKETIDRIKETRLIKAVNQFDKQLNFIKSFNSIAEASRELDICMQNISAVACQNTRAKSAGGFIWRWKSEDESYG